MISLKVTKATLKKNDRLEKLQMLLAQDPYLNDSQLAKMLKVSVPSIRNYRGQLGIKEVRERIRDTVRALAPEDIVGTITDLKLNKEGTARFMTTSDMVFKKTNIVRGQYIYSFAESVAIAVTDSEASLVGVANIKYKEPVYANELLIAKAQVNQIRLNNYFVWVFVYRNDKEIFRSKFILVSV